MQPNVLLLQGDRESNTGSFDDLRRIGRLRPDVAVLLMREHVRFWQWNRSDLNRLIAAHLPVDPRDELAALCRAQSLPQRQRPAGVLTVHDDCLATAAAIAEALSLPTTGVVAVARCRDKRLLREVLDRACIATPRTRMVQSEAECLTAGEALGLPVVVKPRDMAGSIAVQRADDVVALRAAYRIAAAATWGGARHREILVEEMLIGGTHTVNAVMHQGVFHAVATSEKRTTGAPYFLTLEDVMRPAEADDPRVRSAKEATIALGIDNAVVHVELVVNRGIPTILEVTPRPGGGYIVPLVSAATGVDLLGCAIGLCLGETPIVGPIDNRVAVGRYIFPKGRGRILDMHRPSLPAGFEVSWFKDLTDRVGGPPDDYFPALGYVLAHADDEGKARQRIDAFANAVSAKLVDEHDPRLTAALARRLLAKPFRRRLGAQVLASLPRQWPRRPS